MSKNILIIDGNPDSGSLSYDLAEIYKQGAEESHASVKVLHLSEIQFDPILKFGYKKKMSLEPDLVVAQENIKWADHLVFIYPIWWGTYPALLKGFIDRTFLPGFAFNGKIDSVYWEKLLKGKTARIIETLDAPMWFYDKVYKSPAKNSLAIAVLNFCGIKPVDYTVFTPVKQTTEDERSQWLDETKTLGKELA